MLVAEEIGIGLAVGLGLTLLATMFVKFARRQQWLTPTWMQVPVVAMAFGCFALAQRIGGSGFIPAFSVGLLFAVSWQALVRMNLNASSARASSMSSTMRISFQPGGW